MTPRDLTSVVHEALAKGVLVVGQVLVTKLGTDCYELRHKEDLERTDLTQSTNSNDAHEISLLTDHGEYRPLKSAPNLRRGWLLLLKDPSEVRLALDFIYPAALGLWASHRKNLLPPVSLRETLGRQSGMYALAKKITSKEASLLISRTCDADQCLKQILWPIEADCASGQPCTTQLTGTDSLPLLCHEACSILISAARQTVKARTPLSSESRAS
ncbi:MAG: DR2241 family protein [Verrucomicrobiota bacterium]